jgi:hypothetical protein
MTKLFTALCAHIDSHDVTGEFIGGRGECVVETTLISGQSWHDCLIDIGRRRQRRIVVQVDVAPSSALLAGVSCALNVTIIIGSDDFGVLSRVRLGASTFCSSACADI